MGPVGTFKWQAPEFPLHSKAGEVWTVGVIMLSLCRQFKHVSGTTVLLTPGCRLFASVLSRMPESSNR